MSKRMIPQAEWVNNFVKIHIARGTLFLQSAFQFGFYRQNLVFFPWNLIWNSFYTLENPNLVWHFPCWWIKFQLNTTAWSIIIFTWTALPCLYFFLNPASKIMLNMLFNTLLKIGHIIVPWLLLLATSWF